MELTELQEEWLQRLEAHPERQISHILGIKTEDDYKACCLGEAYVMLCEKKGKSPFYLTSDDDDDEDIYIADYKNIECLSRESYGKLNLNDRVGGFRSPGTQIPIAIEFKGQKYNDLAEMNDDGITWPEIAQFIREHPEVVFM